MVDFRKVIISIIIGILFAVFVFSFNAAINTEPQYNDFCKNQYMASPKEAAPVVTPTATADFTCPAYNEPTQAEKDKCITDKGIVEYYDAKGNIIYDSQVYNIQNCPASWKCNMCQFQYDEAHNKNQFYLFLISSIFSLVAILVGLYLPYNKDSVIESIAVGFLLGGLFSLFFGTIIYFGSFQKWFRPTVILIELAIVIFVAFKKLSNKGTEGASKPVLKK